MDHPENNMTEINGTSIGKWWNSVRRFFWSGFGVLCIVGGVIPFIRDGNRVWGWMSIGAGITFAIIPLTTVRCLDCGSLNRFDQVWNIVYKRQHFMCYACGAQHRLPLWTRTFFNIIIFGYGFLTLASGCNQFFFNFIARAPDYLTLVGSLPFVWALTMLLVRFSPYERQDHV